MTVDGMRSRIADAYPYPKWQQKVANMHENQVIAIFKTMQELNRLNPSKFTCTQKNDKNCHQISIWEWMKENESNDPDSERQTVF